jgi:pimeloyl-ACP methyl ester carboxylesterase
MRKRGKIFWFFAAIGLLLAGWIVLALLKTGGIDRGLRENPEYAFVRDVPGVTCELQRISVKLSPGGFREFDLVGELCWTGEKANKTLQVLVSGAGYGAVYWDFPVKPDTYSYARAALKAGDAIFNFDRLGMGLSDHPFGIALDVDTQAYVLYQALNALDAANEFDATVVLGHSFGSTISLAHALTYPEQSDGIVLTGFIHNVNPEFGPSMGQSIGIAAFGGPLVGDLVDPTYVISKPDSRGKAFYTLEQSDPEIIAADNATRETTAVGELISMSRYFKDQSKELAVPVMVLVGEDDFVVCGAAVDCNDHVAVVEHETAFYPASTCPEIYVLDDTNHNANLHLNAGEAFGLMQDWINRRVGSAGNPPTQPCT